MFQIPSALNKQWNSQEFSTGMKNPEEREARVISLKFVHQNEYFFCKLNVIVG